MDKKYFQRIQQNKVFLIDTLTVEADIVLQYVQQNKLITLRDYRNLSDIPERERRVINLLDKLMGKGEETCRQFIDLLRQDCIMENFPTLKDHAIFDSPVQEVTLIYSSSCKCCSQVCSVPLMCVFVLLFQVSHYKIEQIPRGVCVIINNVNFTTMSERRGSDEDQSLFFKHFLYFI